MAAESSESSRVSDARSPAYNFSSDDHYYSATKVDVPEVSSSSRKRNREQCKVKENPNCACDNRKAHDHHTYFVVYDQVMKQQELWLEKTMKFTKWWAHLENEQKEWQRKMNSIKEYHEEKLLEALQQD